MHQQDWELVNATLMPDRMLTTEDAPKPDLHKTTAVPAIHPQLYLHAPISLTP